MTILQQEFGCDNKLGTQRFDNCRVCNGDGSSCTAHTGFYYDGTLQGNIIYISLTMRISSVEKNPFKRKMNIKHLSAIFRFSIKCIEIRIV